MQSQTSLQCERCGRTKHDLQPYYSSTIVLVTGSHVLIYKLVCETCIVELDSNKLTVLDIIRLEGLHVRVEQEYDWCA